MEGEGKWKGKEKGRVGRGKGGKVGRERAEIKEGEG